MREHINLRSSLAYLNDEVSLEVARASEGLPTLQHWTLEARMVSIRPLHSQNLDFSLRKPHYFLLVKVSLL